MLKKVINDYYRNRIKDLEIGFLFKQQDPDRELELTMSYLQLGDYGNASKYLNMYFDQFYKGDPNIKPVAYKYLAQIYLSEGKDEIAYGFLRNYLRTKTEEDSEAQKIADEIKARYKISY